MQFLKTLFWVLIAVLVALFSTRNWFDVTVNLWGDIQADIKLPILLLIAFLLGFLPTWLIMRARIWSHRRRIEAMERNRLAAMPGDATPTEERTGHMRPIFVAIDTPELAQALAIAEAVRGHAGGLKLGLEFFAAQGPAGVRRVASLGLPIFLDLKLHDIPNTVAKAVAALAPLEPAILTVHAAGGREMLTAAKAAAGPQTKVVAVTVLTSLDAGDLASIGVDAAPADQVDRLAKLARDSGIDGIVCSGAEVGSVRSSWRDGFFVVPGVRPAGADFADQKRVVTPGQALEDGASVLVIGRPITGAADPARAIAEIAGKPEKRGHRMSWLSRVRSGIPFLPKRQSAENLWHKCAKCGTMVFVKEWEENYSVCPRCNFHDRIGPTKRFEQLFDAAEYELLPAPEVREDPLRFRDTKRYTDRVKAARAANGERDALVNARGKLGGRKVIIGVQDFAFMGGSMGIAVGAAFACRHSRRDRGASAPTFSSPPPAGRECRKAY